MMPAGRERRMVSVLDGWPFSDDQVVIGGYAVAAYGPARYSQDLDVVVSRASLEGVKEWLRSEGFEFRKGSSVQPGSDALFLRGTDGQATVDILSGAVVDREAKVKIPDIWIIEKSRKTRLILMSSSTQHEVPIARPEAIWALKLQAGRDQDIGDLFSISRHSIDASEIISLFRLLRSKTLSDRLEKVRGKLHEPKLYEDSISRLGRGKPADKRNRKDWSNFVSLAIRIIDSSMP